MNKNVQQSRSVWQTITLALLISLAISLTLIISYLVWLWFFAPVMELPVEDITVEEGLREISNLPLAERRQLVLTSVWGEDYRERILYYRRIDRSPWPLVSFGNVHPNRSYDLLALTVLLLQKYPHIAMDRDHYFLPLGEYMFFDLMQYHISISFLTFFYPEGFESPVTRMRGNINGVLIDETIDFR